MRLIDADELIIFGLDNPDDEHLFQFVPIEIIDSAPTVELPSAQRWIPCSERLPEEHEVLCCDKYGSKLIGWLHYNDYYDCWVCESDECVMYDTVAWMPLPEPFKEENK